MDFLYSFYFFIMTFSIASMLLRSHLIFFLLQNTNPTGVRNNTFVRQLTPEVSVAPNGRVFQSKLLHLQKQTKKKHLT
jgi:hypothetical protein